MSPIVALSAGDVPPIEISLHPLYGLSAVGPKLKSLKEKTHPKASGVGRHGDYNAEAVHTVTALAHFGHSNGGASGGLS
jgi:hypothetical protein